MSKEQRVEAPHHAYLSRHWSNYTEHSCQFSYERKYQDDIKYVRAQPPAASPVQASVPAEPKSNRDPHPFQEHPLYPNCCAFAVGDEDYCKRETDNVIHQVATPSPTAPASVPVAQPPTADAEMVAGEVVGDWLLLPSQIQRLLKTRVATALTAAEQRGRDEQREKDARRCEDLVTYTEDHGGQEPCYWCKALEVAAIVIRSNQ